MPDLYPTKTRLALLRDVDAGYVSNMAGDVWCTAQGDPYKVTARVVEMHYHGWIEKPHDSDWWRLTDAGRAIYDEWGRQ